MDILYRTIRIVLALVVFLSFSGIAQPSKTPEQSHPIGYPHKTGKIPKPDGTQYIFNPNGGPLPPPLSSPVGSGYLFLIGMGLVYAWRKKKMKKNE